VQTATDLSGIGASFGEYSNELNGQWKGTNGKWYDIIGKFNGNRYTGSKSNALSRAAGYNLLGKAMFGISAAMSGVNFVDNVSQGKIANAGKNVLDVAMGYIGLAGGPYGAVVGGVYTLVDVTVGWDKVGEFIGDAGMTIEKACSTPSGCPRPAENRNGADPFRGSLGFPWGCLSKKP
jgi:hypothetical protein